MKNSDQIQKSLIDKVENAYPAVEFQLRVIADVDRKVVCLVVPGSENRPHFAGGAYVRRGSVTQEASAEQFANLICREPLQSQAADNTEGNLSRIASAATRTPIVGVSAAC